MAMLVRKNETGVTIDNVQVETIPHLTNPFFCENTMDS